MCPKKSGKESQLQELLKSASEIGKSQICLLPRKSWVNKTDFPAGVLLATPLYNSMEDRTMTVSIPCEILDTELEKWWSGSTGSLTKGTTENKYTFYESDKLCSVYI